MRASSNFARSATLTEAKAPSQPHDARGIALLSAVLTFAAFAFCSRHQLLLLYGDAVAHLHIARRIFDSRSPGFRQLGSVWLPLSHLLLVPFVQKMSWWQTGEAAALPSMACYVAACVGLYRLALCFVRHSIAWLATAFFMLSSVPRSLVIPRRRRDNGPFPRRPAAPSRRTRTASSCRRHSGR